MDYFNNAYVFEKDLAKKTFHPHHNKKFISVGDYELIKFDSNSGINYGFFASPLEDEQKEIKIGVLDLIGKIGTKNEYKELAMKSFKYIIELVNDEEDEVRYKTIECLEVLIKNFKKIDVSKHILIIKIIRIL